MRPILFRIPIPDWLQSMLPFLGDELPIYGYGVMLVLGFFLALHLGKYLARRIGLDGEAFVNCGLIALLFGVAGSRLSHVLENPDQYFNTSRSAWENFKDAINIRSGGLTFYGGLLLAFPACLLYGRLKKIPLRLGMDIVAPCVMLGLALGRVGCFLNGCCYGAECELPWAVKYPYQSNAYVEEFARGRLDPPPPPELVRTAFVDAAGNERTEAEFADDPAGIRPAPRLRTWEELAARPEWVRTAEEQRSLAHHPAQLYSTFNAFLIVAVLLAFFTLPHAPGQVMALMLMLKGITRFILELLRTERAYVGEGSGTLTFLPAMSYSMVLSIFLLIGGLVMWFVCGRMARRPGTATKNGPTAAGAPAPAPA